jgi:phage shock protein A
VRFASRAARLLPVLRQDRPQELSEATALFERLRDAFRAALDAATPPTDLRQLARDMHEAVVEAKVAVVEMREALVRTEREVALEQQRLADAERRGRLAGEIQDQETVAVAARFAAKHRERAGVLERKLATQREELALAERDLTEMQTALKTADRDRLATEGDRSTERAWRDVQSAGGARPGMDLQDELLKSEMDRAAREAAAGRQLEELKKRMRKD